MISVFERRTMQYKSCCLLWSTLSVFESLVAKCNAFPFFSLTGRWYWCRVVFPIQFKKKIKKVTHIERMNSNSSFVQWQNNCDMKNTQMEMIDFKSIQFESKRATQCKNMVSAMLAGSMVLVDALIGIMPGALARTHTQTPTNHFDTPENRISHFSRDS